MVFPAASPSGNALIERLPVPRLSCGSLRAALNAAASGDTISFAVTGTITLAGPLPAIGENPTIAGPGAMVAQSSTPSPAAGRP